MNVGMNGRSHARSIRLLLMELLKAILGAQTFLILTFNVILIEKVAQNVHHIKIFE